MDEKTVLSLTNITKRYPGVLALNRVSLEFLEGKKLPGIEALRE